MSSIDKFPTRMIHPERELYRVHRAVHIPFHFAVSTEPGSGGRFDLPPEAGSGTCYLASSALGALLETFGRFRAVTMTLVNERRLTAVTPAVALRLADLTERRNIGAYGVTGDISTGTDYVLPQQWALRFFEAGFDGIYYAARHDPAFTERSVALFGRSDDLIDGIHKSFEAATTAIPLQALSELAQEFGIHVLPATDLTDGGLR